MSHLLRTLQEVAVFMLGAQVLLYLGPGKKYEKYGKMILSMLVLVQLAEPVLSIGKMDTKPDFAAWLAQFEQENDDFLDKLSLMDAENTSFVWEGAVLSIEQQLTEEAKRQGVRIERVLMEEGRCSVEVGSLYTGRELSDLKENLEASFLKILNLTEGELEVRIVE